MWKNDFQVGFFFFLFFPFYRTKLLRKIYDEYDLNIEKEGNPVGFTSTYKNSTHIYITA